MNKRRVIVIAAVIVLAALSLLIFDNGRKQAKLMREEMLQEKEVK